MLAKRDHQRFFFSAEHRGAGLLRPHRRIRDRRPLLPLRHGVGVHVIPLGKLGYALLTLLDRSTQRRGRAGAPVRRT